MNVSEITDERLSEILKWVRCVSDQEIIALARAELSRRAAKVEKVEYGVRYWRHASSGCYCKTINMMVVEELGTIGGGKRDGTQKLVCHSCLANPVTEAEYEAVKPKAEPVVLDVGVKMDGVMQTLLERGLVEQMGRAEVIGRPMTFGTTGLFLDYFGLRGLDGLPAADELRRVPVQKPESLLTVDPGLATAPPEQLQMVEMKEGSTTPTASDTLAPAPPVGETPTEPSSPPTAS